MELAQSISIEDRMSGLFATEPAHVLILLTIHFHFMRELTQGLSLYP
jgi:hypothetical protein